MLVLDKGFFVVGMKLCEKEILDKANLLFEDFWGKRFEGWGRLVAVGRDHRTEVISANICGEGLVSGLPCVWVLKCAAHPSLEQMQWNRQ